MSVLEVTSVIEKMEGKVVGSLRLRFKVTMAEHGSRILSPIAALTTGGREIEGAMVAGSWFCGCGLHFLSLRCVRPGGFLRRGTPPRMFFRERVGIMYLTNPC
jgi:hypothetical protein